MKTYSLYKAVLSPCGTQSIHTFANFTTTVQRSAFGQLNKLQALAPLNVTYWIDTV